jgi:hypothetical protein
MRVYFTKLPFALSFRRLSVWRSPSLSLRLCLGLSPLWRFLACTWHTPYNCFRMWQSRIADSVRYEHMTVDSLKLLCKRRQLKVSGTKHELIRKLIQPQPSDRIPPPHPPPAADQGSSISDRVRGERDPANKGFQGHELPSMDFVRAHTQQRNTHTHTHTHTAAMHQSFVHLLSLLPLTGLSRLAPYYRIWACYALRSPQKIHT